MQIKTFRAKSMPQALELVRTELGPAATVLHAREVNASLLGRMWRGREYEIAATLDQRSSAAETVPPRISPAAASTSRQETS